MASKKSPESLAKRKLITPKFRVSYPYIFEKYEGDDGKSQYSVTAIFPKDTDLSALRKAAKFAAREEFGDDLPGGFRWPWRDGDEERPGKKEYEDCYFIPFTAKKKQPGIVDRNKEDIIDADDFYAGCYARAEVVAYAYNKKGKRGVSFDLWNLQKLKDGEPLGTTRNAAEAFPDDDDEDDRPKKSKRRDDDDEDDRPKKSKRRDDDDEDDGPKKSKRRDDDYSDYSFD